MREFELPYTITRQDTDIDGILVYQVTKFYPAKTYGPPEDCYPEEGGDIDVLAFFGDENHEIELTDAEIYEAQKWLYKNHYYDPED